jgi:superfamily II DNA or RNA helicase
LSNLVLYTDNSTVASNLDTSTYTPLLFRVVTQKYGGGIVNPNYNTTQAPFNTSTTGGNGAYFDNVCSVTGLIYLEIDAQVPVCVSCSQSTPDGYSGATLTASQWSGASSLTNIKAAWRRYEDLEFEDKIGEVSFDLESVTVSVTERKLRAQWSPELAQDVAAFHNIDAEAELTALLSEQVAAEIDREILRDLRLGVIDVLIGINLLREGLDLPEVSLVAILDADKEGFLRSERSLIQTIGRAARNDRGRVIMYADKITNSMRVTIEETNRRREKQVAYNTKHGITPRTVGKSREAIIEQTSVMDFKGGVQKTYIEKEMTDNLAADPIVQYMTKPELQKSIDKTKKEMALAAKEMDFLLAAKLRDEMFALEKVMEERFN